MSKDDWLHRIVFILFAMFLFVSAGIGLVFAGEKVVLTVASGILPTEIEIRREIAELYEAINPEVEIEMVYLQGDRFSDQQMMIVGGVAPDILYINQTFLAPWASQGALLDLTEFIQKDNFTFEHIPQSIMDSVMFEHKVYAMPFEVSPLALVYNATLFEEAGLSVPPVGWEDPNWRWDDLRQTARKLTKVDQDGEIQRYGLGSASWWWWNWVFQNGGRPLNEDNSRTLLHEQAATDGLQFYIDLMFEDRVAPTDAAIGWDFDGAFMTGRIAMEVQGRWLNTFRKEISDFKWNTAALPWQVEPGTLLLTLHYGISSQCQHPEVAWDFLKFLVSEQPQFINTLSGMAVPVNTSVGLEAIAQSSAERSEETFLYALPYGHAEPTIVNYGDWVGKVNEGLYQGFSGEVSVSAAMQGIVEAADAMLQP
ncbi:MAG: sugar ABC transporter substrate-binding protein [Limnochordia bacterium]|nr:sugar ABC transporter substrate-binding protein [Limnochordia bacterium]